MLAHRSAAEVDAIVVTMPKAGPYALKDFIADMEAAAQEESDQSAIVDRVKPCLEELLKHRSFLTDDQRQLDPANPGQNGRTVLYKAPDGTLSVLAVVFPEGKPTPVHDHLTWGMVGVYEGGERETKYRRVDDGSREDYAEIVEIGPAEYEPGQVTAFVPPDDIHRVEAVSSVKSVSIHVYGTDIGELDRHKFDLATGRILPFKTGPAKRAELDRG